MAAEGSFQQFTRSTVHDLRESVRTISLFTELLAERLSGQVDSESQKHLDFVKGAAVRLQTLLNGIGEFSVALGSPQWVSPVELRMTARGAASELESLAQSTGAEIIIGNLPDVIADFDAMQMVFRHLLHNSIQYRRDAPLQIQVSAVEANGGGPSDVANNFANDVWTIKVEDNGAGMEDSFLPRIFDPYSRGYGRDRAGNGLGLTICQKIIEGHGGKIWAESVYGQGSSLFFTLPKDGPPER